MQSPRRIQPPPEPQPEELLQSKFDASEERSRSLSAELQKKESELQTLRAHAGRLLDETEKMKEKAWELEAKLGEIRSALSWKCTNAIQSVIERLMPESSAAGRLLARAQQKIDTLLLARRAQRTRADSFFPRFIANYCASDLRREKHYWNGGLNRPVAIDLDHKGIETRFTATANSLFEIAIAFGTYGRQNSNHVQLELFEEQASVPCRKVQISALILDNNAFHSFRFEPLGNSSGKRFRLRLSSDDTTSSNRVAVWGIDASGTIQPSTLTGDVEQITAFVPPTPYVDLEDYLKLPLGFREGLLPGKALSDQRVLLLVGEAVIAKPWISELTVELGKLELRYEVHSIASINLNFDFDAFDVAVLCEVPADIPNRLIFSVLRHERMAVISVFEKPLSETASSSPSRLKLLRETESISDHTIFLTQTSLRLFGPTLSGVINEHRRRVFPTFSIVSVLFRKEREVGHFLEALCNQTYQGEFEVIFVDDCSPDNSVRAVENFLRGRIQNGAFVPPVQILRNEKNIGNCGSRNKAISHAHNDVVVVIDADCVVNRDFLATHANRYAFKDCDAVVGYFNLETGEKAPAEALQYYEQNRETLAQDAALQDRNNLPSYLNCITRNFSIRREKIEGKLFDEQFAYSTNPDSGFGWEDIEMGYRLYQRGLRVGFADSAFSVHISHPANSESSTLPLRSFKNFSLLLETHPEIKSVSRAWVSETFQKICLWWDAHQQPVTKERDELSRELVKFSRSRAFSPNRRLRILTYRWHPSHQYEIYKLPHDFTLATGLGTPFTNAWEYAYRPLAPNARFRPWRQINPSDFDLAILHFDENVLSPHLTNGVIDTSWGETFQSLRSGLKIPLVAVCHGTPQFHGQYDIRYSKPDLLQEMSEERERLVNYLGDTLVICNSHQAKREWGFKNSKVIWHGFDPAEYPLSTYAGGILSLGEAMKSRPHYRGYALYNKTVSLLNAEDAPASPQVPEPNLAYLPQSNAFAYSRFRNYVDMIRHYSIYFNPTLRSPMPRSRAEAMMCGLVTVSANNHDVDMFIKNGENGFYSNDAGELAEYLKYLLANPEKARDIGQRGRATATDIFNNDRFLADWQSTLADLKG